MTDQEKEEFVQKAKQLLANIRNAIIDVVNEIPHSPFNLPYLIKQWKKQRQVLNNKNIGIIISFEKLGLVIFPLFNDEKRDVGQKNLDETSTDQMLTQEDKDFLKQIGIQL